MTPASTSCTFLTLYMYPLHYKRFVSPQNLQSYLPVQFSVWVAMFSEIGYRLQSCLPFLEYNGTRGHLTLVMLRACKRIHLKNSTAVTLSRNDYLATQDNPQTLFCQKRLGLFPFFTKPHPWTRLQLAKHTELGDVTTQRKRTRFVFTPHNVLKTKDCLES